MMLALGAISTAMDALKALTQKPAAKPVGGSSPVTTAFEPEAASDRSRKESSSTSSTSLTGGTLSPETLSAVLAAMGLGNPSVSATTPVSAETKSDPLKDLLAELDADGDGQVSLSEFKDGLGAGGTNSDEAAAVFGKLDADADGAVSLDEMAAVLKPKGESEQARAGGGGGGGGGDPLLQALAGASSTRTTNSDGTVTTSLTYADGSKVTMTSAAAASASATSSYNFIEQLIQRQADSVAKSSGSSVSLNA